MVAEREETERTQQKGKKGCKITKTAILIIILIMTASFFLVELVVGHLTKSNALVNLILQFI